MSQQRIPYGDQPPAYSYGYGDYNMDDHDESPMRSNPTMRLLPTSSQVESDLSSDLGTHRSGDPFSDDNQ